MLDGVKEKKLHENKIIRNSVGDRRTDRQVDRQKNKNKNKLGQQRMNLLPQTAGWKKYHGVGRYTMYVFKDLERGKTRQKTKEKT